MRVEADRSRCVGHGVCEALAGDVFTVGDDGIVQIRVSDIPETDRHRIVDAVSQCPTGTLRVQE